MPLKKILVLCLGFILAFPYTVLAVPQVGDPAPDFTLPTLDGNSLQLYKVLTNPGETKGVVLNFFSLTCRPCRYELPELEKLYKEYKDKGILMVALSLDDDISAEVISKYMKKLGVTFPVVLKAEEKTARDYGIRPIPATFIIGPNKKIESRLIGFSQGNLKAIEAKVKELCK